MLHYFKENQRTKTSIIQVDILQFLYIVKAYSTTVQVQVSKISTRKIIWTKVIENDNLIQIAN